MQGRGGGFTWSTLLRAFVRVITTPLQFGHSRYVCAAVLVGAAAFPAYAAPLLSSEDLIKLERQSTKPSNELLACEAIPNALPAASAPRRRDPSCYVSADSALLKAENAVLVDVRPAAEYSRYRVANSVNLPLHSLKTKAFLKDKTLMLVSRGIAEIDLERECQILKSQGYRPSIVQGGIRGLQEARATFVGQYPGPLALGAISAAELFEELKAENAKTVFIGTAAARGPPKSFPKSFVIDRPDPALVAKKLRQLKGSMKQPTRIVITDIAGRDYATIQSIVQRAGFKDVWYLSGGATAYEAFTKRQLAMWERMEHPPRRRCAG